MRCEVWTLLDHPSRPSSLVLGRRKHHTDTCGVHRSETVPLGEQSKGLSAAKDGRAFVVTASSARIIHNGNAAKTVPVKGGTAGALSEKFAAVGTEVRYHSAMSAGGLLMRPTATRRTGRSSCSIRQACPRSPPSLQTGPPSPPSPSVPTGPY